MVAASVGSAIPFAEEFGEMKSEVGHAVRNIVDAETPLNSIYCRDLNGLSILRSEVKMPELHVITI